MPMMNKSTAYSSEPYHWQESALMLPQNSSSSVGEDNNSKKTDGRAVVKEMEGPEQNEYAEGSTGAVYSAFHLACVAGNVECVKLLLERGVIEDLNRKICGLHGDFHDGLLTPLCCAVSCRNNDVVQMLLDSGAEVNLCCGPMRSSPLHFAAAEEDNAVCIQTLLKAGACHGTRDAKDQMPLHIAASVNDPESIAILLGAGAEMNVIDSAGRTPLHTAVANCSKRVSECVRILLENGKVNINAQDEYGYTALHLSAVNEDPKCTSLLLKHGSDVTLKTSGGTTALSMLVRKMPDVMNHLIKRLDSGVTLHENDAADANCQLKMDFTVLIPTGCNEALFSMKTPSKKVNDNGDGGEMELPRKKLKQQRRRRKETELLTCLVSTGNKKLLAHPLSEAFLLLKWRRVRKFFLASLLFQMALVALFTVFVVEVYLIRCPYRRHHADDSEGSIASPKEPHTMSKRSAHPYPNPVDSSDGGFHWFRVVPSKKKKQSVQQEPPLGISTQIPPPPPPSPARAAFIPSTTTNPRFRSKIVPPNSELEGIASTSDDDDIGDKFNSFSAVPSPDDSQTNQQESELMQACSLSLPIQGIWILLVVSISVMGLQELFQLVHSPSRYLVSSENWAQWLLITSVLITAWRGNSISGESGEFKLEYWQYPTAACGILIAWGLILFQVGRFPSLGLYVEMLGKVAANFGLFISAYACLLIAFALSFCVLFPEHPPFSSVPLSILKVFTMMVGEVDYEDLFYSEERSHDPILFPLTAHLLFGAFVLIMTIVLMNLLVGLAVSDIQGLQKGAKLDRLSRQTALIARFESFIFSKKLQAILPSSLIRMVQENSLLVGGGGDCNSSQQHHHLSFYFRPNDPRDRSLPKDIKQAALSLVTTSKNHASLGKSLPSSENHTYSQKNVQQGVRLRRSLSSTSQWLSGNANLCIIIFSIEVKAIKAAAVAPILSLVTINKTEKLMEN